MNKSPWIPLHVHSQYSILDATASVEDLVSKAHAYGMQALALTDQGNMYGAVEFYKTCQSLKVKPILGCELHLAPSSRFDKRRIPGSPAGFPLILLAKDKVGYRNLCKLSSAAHVEGFYYTPRIDRDLLGMHSEGLICLSGPIQGRLGFLALQGREEELVEEAFWFQKLFKDDFYFELQRHQMSEEDIRADGIDRESWLLQNHRDYVRNQEVVGAKLQDLGKKLGIRCVATNDTHYIERKDWKPHEILMNIQSGEPCEIWERDSSGNLKNRVLNPKRDVYFSHEYDFKSSEQMVQLFADIPEALEATIEIADKIEFQFDFKAKYYPVYTPPETSTKEDFLKELCETGISKKYTPERLAEVAAKYPGKSPLEVVRQRLAYELDIITSKGMCDYILIVYDFIAWAKQRKIPVGPGRGSGVGSIILFLIGITDMEPLRFNLFFERFINPERPSYPDVDVDICMDRRSEVIDYTVQKYGKDKVAQIITFGTMKAKMALKDVGRMLSVPLSKVNQIAKLVPEDLNITLAKALEVDPDLKREYENDAEVREMIDIAEKLEGSVRSTGIHAAGMIISGHSLTDCIPVCNPKDSAILATQFSMKPVEAVGMLKIDFLGLKTLTSIQKTVDAIRERWGVEIDWKNLPLDDKTAFNLLNSGKMLGIFQMESGGMQDLARQLHIDRFEEIVAVVSLYRPGPMEMIPSFINRKHGREQIEIDHPLMKGVLDETYGIMVYQEQVMQIASLLAGYSLGEGDVLRRAMGKKDHDEMAKQREKFRAGALQKGISEELSMKIFDKIEKFASYGFNKSHAVAYGYLAYATAYLKANYPGEWMAALMTCDRDDTAKVAKVIAECQQATDISILPPDVNESGLEFVATSKGIRFAMGAIKGIGEGVVEAVVAERKKNGPFRSLYDFCRRIDTKKIGKKSLELLIESGCFDFTHISRASLVESAGLMFDAASQRQKEAAKGFIDFFAALDEPAEIPLVSQNEPPRREILHREKELLGFYLTGHPLEEFRELMDKLSCVPLSQLSSQDHDTVCRTSFIVEEVQTKISNRTQKKFAILQISDGVERLEVPIWPELYESKASLLVENQLMYAVIQVDKREGDLKLQCQWLDDLTRADEAMIKACDAAFDQAKRSVRSGGFKKSPRKPEEKKEMPKTMVLKLDADQIRLSQILEIKRLFRAYPGSNLVQIEFWQAAQKLGIIRIEGEWRIRTGAELERELKKIPSIASIALTE